MNPLLSIIIPIYNSENYLPNCLDGILTAALPAVELLLIDDGSTDRSLAICRSYAQRYPFIYVESQSNSGPAAVRNRGLDESRGEYIAFLDADDCIDPAAFRRTVQLLEAYDAQVWVSDFHRIAANGCILDKVYQIEETEKPITDPAYMEHFLSDGERVWNVWRYIFRRDFLLENGLRFIEGVNCAEDVEFVVRALTRVTRPVFFHNPYYFYRAHYGDTLTRQYTVRRVEQLMQMLCLSAEHALDNEKMNVLEKFGYERLSYFEACKYRNSLDETQDAVAVFEEYAASPYRAKGPTVVDSRYISEDVPQGLVMLEALSQHLGLETPVCTGLINIASAALGRDLRAEGRTLERLGEENVQKIFADSGRTF